MQPSRLLLLTNVCIVVVLVSFVALKRLPLAQVWVVAPVSFVALNLAAIWGLRMRKKRTPR
jgi:hypothetical protein